MATINYKSVPGIYNPEDGGIAPHLCVKLDSAGVLSAAVAEPIVGITQMQQDVAYEGVAKASVSGAVDIGDPVTPTTGGQVTVAVSTNKAIGVALTAAGAADEVISVLLRDFVVP